MPPPRRSSRRRSRERETVRPVPGRGRAGGGRYEIMLGIAVDFLTQRAGAFEKIRSALAYPVFLLTASFIAIGF